MTKSTITRERLEELASGQSGFNLRIATLEESQQLASMALAAFDSEPHTDDELSNLLWYSQEAACHSDPNYYCEFQRLATPGFIAWITRELQERRKAEKDSEPVAWTWHYREQWHVTNDKCRAEFVAKDGDVAVLPLYRHAQQPVVPDDVLDALQKVARTRLDLNDFDGDRRGIADCLGDAEEALIEVVNRRAAMLAAAPQEVPDEK